MAALVQAFSSQDLEKAFDLYCQLRQDSAGAAAVTLSDRFMWQSLIEVACRKYRVDLALQVCTAARSNMSYYRTCVIPKPRKRHLPALLQLLPGFWLSALPFSSSNIHVRAAARQAPPDSPWQN